LRTKILVVVAHPDDEVLGCGGTIAKRTNEGDEVKVLFIADGVSSRLAVTNDDFNEVVKQRRDAAKQACLILGVSDIKFSNFPDNQLDTVSLLNIVRTVEKEILEFEPDEIWTHHSGDLNIDHRVTFQAVVTAARPLPGSKIVNLQTFEILSSTEWQPSSSSFETFRPNLFIDISEFLDLKLKAIDTYHMEMHLFPHPRSNQGIEILARSRGMSAGSEAAEAFTIVRKIN